MKIKKNKSVIIESIEPHKNNITFEEMNCYEHTIGNALTVFRKEWVELFYMVALLHRSFDFNILKNIGYYLRFKKMLKEYFNINLKKEDGGILVNRINELLYSGKPALVPINLKEIYYSNYYKTTDWRHLLLICGFDSIKKTYNMVDYLHLSADVGDYARFYIRDNDLIKANNSFKEVFSGPHLMSIDKINDIYISSYSVLDKVITETIQCLKKSQNREYAMMNAMKKNCIIDISSQKNINEIRKIINIPKSRRMLYRLILNFSRGIDGIDKEAERIIELSDIIFEDSSKLIRIFIRDLMRGNALYYEKEKMLIKKNELLLVKQLCILRMKNKHYFTNSTNKDEFQI